MSLIKVFKMCGLEEGLLGEPKGALLRAGVLRDCFRSLADSMFRQFSREQKSDRGLDFARRHRLVFDESRCFRCNLFEQVINKGVHHAHCLRRDTNVWVNLLEDSVDVSTIGFSASASPFSSILPFSFLPTFLRACSFRRTRLSRTCFLWTSSHV